MTATENNSVQRFDVNPAELLVDRNIRLDTRVDGDFVTSIKDHGVLVPIVAVRTTNGALRVRFGHRRTAAAIQAGLDIVPVDVIGDEGGDDSAQIERVITQYAENAQRTGLNVGDELNVVEQLSAFGLSAHQINKRTRIKRAAVDVALAVSSSELAKKATQRYDFLSLDQAAAVAEFENDNESVKELVVAAKNGTFDHTLQRLRDDRAEREAQQAILTELHEEGVTVIDRPVWGSPVRHLANLSTDDNPITVETHAGCPGHAAYLAEVWTDADDSEDDESAELGWEPVYVCTDPVANGHIEPRQMHRGRAAATTEADEQAKREDRRRVIVGNKAWRSAESVRREWLSKHVVIRVLVADDQVLVRQGFALILGTDAGIDVVGEAGNGVQLLAGARQTRPDVVLMDIQMPEMDGIEATRHLTSSPQTAGIRVLILILTTFGTDEYVYQALAAGASGFLLKDTAADDLIAAVRTVAAGDALLAPAITRSLIEKYVLRPGPRPQHSVPGPALPALTERERDTLAAVARGLSNTEIAGELHVSYSTVKTHVSHR